MGNPVPPVYPVKRICRAAVKPDPKVKCPTCRKEGDWFSTAHGPFCSRRCKLVDLGKWFNEEHTVSEPLRPEHLEKYADLPGSEDLDRPESEDQKD